MLRHYLADTYTIHHDPGDPWDGQILDIAGFMNRVRISRAPFPDQQFHVREMLADERRVAVTWLWTATHTGVYPGFPATGKPINIGRDGLLFRQQRKNHGALADHR
jgi:predicted ester cyclase